MTLTDDVANDYVIEIWRSAGRCHGMVRELGILVSGEVPTEVYGEVEARIAKLFAEARAANAVGALPRPRGHSHMATGGGRRSVINTLVIVAAVVVGLLAVVQFAAWKSSSILAGAMTHLREQVAVDGVSLGDRLVQFERKLSSIDPGRKDEIRTVLHNIVADLEPLTSELRPLVGCSAPLPPPKR